MSKGQLTIFSESIDRAIRDIERKEHLRPLRRVLLRATRELRDAVAATLSAGMPAANPAGVSRTVRGKVYRDTSAVRVYVAHSRRHGMMFTGRGAQPMLPLAFWYEHGFKGPRQTRGRRGRAPHSTGPAGPVAGIGALDSNRARADEIEGRVNAELERYYATLLDRIHAS